MVEKNTALPARRRPGLVLLEETIVGIGGMFLKNFLSLTRSVSGFVNRFARLSCYHAHLSLPKWLGIIFRLTEMWAGWSALNPEASFVPSSLRIASRVAASRMGDRHVERH